jgi:hypothetical protein
MFSASSFASCFDTNGRLDLEKYQFHLMGQEDESDDEDGEDSDDNKPPKKRPFRSRTYEGYDPGDALSSEWHRRYVSIRKTRKGKKHLKKFRRRFRMPYHCFQALVAEARAENWFSTREKRNALGQSGVPLDILVLGALRYLGNISVLIQ